MVKLILLRHLTIKFTTMLVAFTLWMIREYRAAGNRKEFLRRINHRLPFKVIRRAGILFLFFLFTLTLKAQDQKRKYDVVRNGDVIGQMSFQQESQGTSTHLMIESNVKTRFVLLLMIWAREESIYRDGVLVFSSILRKLNGKEKTNIQMKREGNTYQVSNKGSIAQHNGDPIRFNLLSMYSTEPKLISKAYADNFGRFVPVEKTGKSQYKVTLPDGNHNNYFYHDGICTRVEVHHSLYSLKFILTR